MVRFLPDDVNVSPTFLGEKATERAENGMDVRFCCVLRDPLLMLLREVFEEEPIALVEVMCTTPSRMP